MANLFFQWCIIKYLLFTYDYVCLQVTRMQRYMVAVTVLINTLCNKMSVSFWYVTTDSFNSPHAVIPFFALSGKADKTDQVLPPLVLVGKCKSCNHQQGCSNRAGTPTLGVRTHLPLSSHKPFSDLLGHFPDLLRKIQYVNNTYHHILLVCVTSAVSIYELIWVEAHTTYVGDPNTL